MSANQDTGFSRGASGLLSEDMIIWRYMDFTKFVALLETQSLFFVRIAHLDDLFEGSFPMTQTPMHRILEMLPHGIFPDRATVTVSPSSDLVESWKVMRNWAMVSCWHAVPYESAAMWKLYAPSGVGLAVASTVGRLRQVLGTPPPLPPGFFGREQYRIGLIEYIDFSSSHIPIEDGGAQFFRKHRSFEHERELRALLMRWPVNADGWFDYEKRPSDGGQRIRVDLNKLIHEIRVAPQAPRWYSELVSDVVSRYAIDAKPQQSELDVNPLY